MLDLSKRIILDGALGTQLQRKGMPVGANPCVYGIENPEILESIHRAYFEAGSEVVLSNTFGAGELKLQESGYSVEEVTKRAVACAKNAAKDFNGKVALDVGPLGELLEPLGSLPFERAVELFARQMKAGEEAGADLIFIETMMDLYEAKAALLSAKENTSLPVFVTMTFEEGGKTFTGCGIREMAYTLTGLSADAIGINCSVGPDKLLPLIRDLRKYTELPIIAKPNAGLPNADGSYDLTVDEFSFYMEKLCESGASLLGGCCGTTPEHIKKMKEKTENTVFAPRPDYIPCTVCSATKAVDLSRPVTVGERLNPTGKKLLKQALTDGDMNYICRQAIEQQAQGADVLDINVGLPTIDEKEMMGKVVRAVQSVSSLPVQIDSSDPKAIEEGLRVANGRAIVNSVNGKDEVLDEVLPLVKKYGAVVIGLTLDEKGIPETAEGRVEIAKKIIKRSEEWGISKKDIVIDCLTMTVGVNSENAKITLEALSEVKKLGVKTALGVSNISFGLPRRDIVNRTFLACALRSGLDLAIINPGDELMMQTMESFRLLGGFDEGGKEYIEKYSASVVKNESGTKYTLKASIDSGLCEEAAKATDELLEKVDAQTLISDYLIPILDDVGLRYEKGEIYLPQLMRSAEAAGAACDKVKQRLAKEGGEHQNSGTIVLATVHGDIHDIGKNIVRAVLENYGYKIVDLGRDVSPETVLEAVLKTKAKLCGLSALMTTTVPSMEKTVKLIKEKAPFCKTVVGGAVLSKDIAEKIGADFYAKDASESAKVAKEVYKDK